jgi:FkbM family methyltransferase
VSGNTETFSGKAEAYVRYRERFEPEVLLPILRDWCQLKPQWVIADVGAGTGMLSEIFLANGNAVIAVEPNAEMRAQCEKLLGYEPRLRIVDAPAEATGLPDGSVEMVAVGRALHWFDLERAMAEFRRILKPGGWVFVVGAGRDDDSSAANVALRALMDDYAAAERNLDRVVALYERVGEFFTQGTYLHREIPGEMRLDWERLRGMMLSASMAPVNDAARLAEFEQRLRAVFEEFSRDSEMVLRTRYTVSAGQFER